MIRSSNFGRNFFPMLGIVSRNPPPPRLQRAFWTPLSPNRFSLHLDRKFVGGIATVGGIVRDEHGTPAGVFAGLVGPGYRAGASILA